MGIKSKKAADKAAKEAIGMPGITTIELPYTDYYPTIRKTSHSKWQIKQKTSTNKLNNVKLIMKIEK